MSVLVGSVAGASGRLSGGLAMVAGLMVSDVPPTALQMVRPTVNPTQPDTGVGRFRRHLTGLTTDLMNAPLGGVSVEWFNLATDLSAGAGVSDVAGVYDVPVYVDGTYQAMIFKAGSPNVFGSSDRVAPV